MSLLSMRVRVPAPNVKSAVAATAVKPDPALPLMVPAGAVCRVNAAQTAPINTIYFDNFIFMLLYKFCFKDRNSNDSR